MPTYRYECARCGRVHEYFQAISEPPKKRCPDCGGRLERLIGGGAGIILKGSGFHRTDYRSKSWHKGARKEGGASKEGGSGSKGGAAPDAKPPSKGNGGDRGGGPAGPGGKD
jgi:putative FmdB family regulatory protein